MKNVYSSPSSLVFLILASALCVFVYLGKVEAKDFMLLAVMAFQHYFQKLKPVAQTVDNSLPTSGQLG